jgi:hypothetical protein
MPLGPAGDLPLAAATFWLTLAATMSSPSWRTMTSMAHTPIRTGEGPWRCSRRCDAKALAAYSGRGTTSAYSLSTARSPLKTIRRSSSGVPSALAMITLKCASQSHCRCCSSLSRYTVRTCRSIAEMTSTAARPPLTVVDTGAADGSNPTSRLNVGSARNTRIVLFRTRNAFGRDGSARPAAIGSGDFRVCGEAGNCAPLVGTPRLPCGGETGGETRAVPPPAKPAAVGSGEKPAGEPELCNVGYANDEPLPANCAQFPF